MARYIHCEKCKNSISEKAKTYGELYEYVEGIALNDMLCDGICGNEQATPIKKGDKCYAAVLLPNKFHFNYEKQKPENWAKDFINISI